MNKWRSKSSAIVKRILTATLALGLITGTLFVVPLISDAANEKVDLTKTCSITAKAADSQDQYIDADLVTAGVLVDYYKVADAEGYILSDGYKFKVTDQFRGKLTIPDEMDNDKWNALAQEALTLIEEGIEKGTPYTVAQTVDLGNKFSGDAGLYLVLARGKNDVKYIETVEQTSVNASNETVTTKTKVTIANGVDYIFMFSPEFVSVPTKDPDPVTGEINTANKGDWIYDTLIYLKYNVEPRVGKLILEKKLTVYEKTDPAYFLFTVEATKNGKKVYSRLLSMLFTKACLQTITIEGLPAGADVVVTEVYSGCNYKLVSSGVQTTTIQANDTVKVQFENTYENHEKHCGAITNHFEPVLNPDGTQKLDDNNKPVYTWKAWEDRGEEDQN